MSSLVELGFFDRLPNFLTLLIVVLIISWQFCLQLGRWLNFRFSGIRSEEGVEEIVFAFWCGLAATSILLVAGLGAIGLFRAEVLLVGGAVIQLLLHRARISTVPKIRRASFPFSAVEVAGILGVSLLVFLHAVQSPAQWMDDAQTVFAGHLGKTGLLPDWASSSGKFGWIFLGATLQMFFPQMFTLNLFPAWAFVFAILLMSGMILLVRLATVRSQLGLLGLAIAIFPVAFTMYEGRASVVSFVAGIWWLVAFLRLIDTKSKGVEKRRRQVVFVGTGLAAWLLYPNGLVYFLPVVSVAAFFLAPGAMALQLAVLAPWIGITAFAYGGGSLAIALAGLCVLMTILFRAKEKGGLGSVRLPSGPRLRQGLFGLILLLLVAGVWVNPPSLRFYNWVWFGAAGADFLTFNFGVYGLLGWLWPLALAAVFVERRKWRHAEYALYGFSVFAFALQIALQWVIRYDLALFQEIAVVWDLWKNIGLYLNPLLIVLSVVLLVDLVRDRVGDALRPVWVLLLLWGVNLQNPTEAYSALWNSGERGIAGMIGRMVERSGSPQLTHSWRGSTTQSLVNQFFYGLHWSGRARVHYPEGIPGCAFCGIATYDFMKDQMELIYLLAAQKIRPGDRILGADAPLDPWTHTRRIFRYASGVDSYEIIYMPDTSRSTLYDPAWVPALQISRNGVGWPYTVFSPRRNLLRSRAEPGPRSGSLRFRFEPIVGGDHELTWRGAEKCGPDELAWYEERSGQRLSKIEWSAGLGVAGLSAGREVALVAESQSDACVESLREAEALLYPKRLRGVEAAILRAMEGDQATGKLQGYFTGIPWVKTTVDDFLDLLLERDPERLRARLAEKSVRFIWLGTLAEREFAEWGQRVASIPWVRPLGPASFRLYEVLWQ